MKREIVFLGSEEGRVPEKIARCCRIVSPEDYDLRVLEGVKGIAAVIDESTGERVESLLLQTRFNPSTCHIPFFVWGREWKIMNSRFWPRITGDTSCIFLNEERFRRWCEDRSAPGRNDGERDEWSSFAELLIWLVNSGRSYGSLSFKAWRGQEGVVRLEGERVIFCKARELEGAEAFFELMTWSRGEFLFEPAEPNETKEINVDKPFFELFQDYGLMLDECRHAFNFIGSFQDKLELIPGHCALDDKADKYFKGYEYICRMIEKGVSIDEILATAPLSAIRSLGYIYRLLCFGDARPLSPERRDERQEEGEVLSCAIKFVRKHGVLVVDDAPFFQKVLKRILERDHRLMVIGTAKDGIDCLEKVEEYDPDVITLDIEMPRLDGLGALKRIMVRSPKPVVVLSAFTGETSRLTYEAFKFGAVDVIEKPRSYSASDLEQKEREILERVVKTASVQVEQLSYVRKRQSNNFHGDGKDLDSDIILINYFGEGSFSQFLKALSYGNWNHLTGRAIFIVPLTGHAVNHMYEYIKEDFPYSIELLPDKGDVEVAAGRIYLLGNDRFPGAKVEKDSLFLCSGDERYTGAGEFIEALVAELVKAGSYRPVISAISGSADVAGSLMRVAERGVALYYLNPRRCLLPDLAQALRTAGIGFEVDTIEEMVRIWANPDNYINKPSTELNRQVQ